jgi:AGCS family alanine or glycine:cation symporter
VQFRYFFKSWKYVFYPIKGGTQTENYITPFQAFLNTLSASIGNGAAAGMATAVVGGGPGAAFWIFVFGFLYMVIRYA